VITDGHISPVDAERLRSVLDELRVRNGQLERALGSRIVIEQAKGVLAERYGIDLDDAFVLLRSAARSNRARIHDLAGQIIVSRTSPPEIELERLKDVG
jgi:AmiR/NasT family two-component response regulator